MGARAAAGARARRWTLQEVVSRWTRLFKAPALIECWQRAECDAAGVTIALVIITQRDYLTLVDWSGRAVRSDKRSAIASDLPPILRLLNIDAAAWKMAMRPRGNVFGQALGQLDHLRLHAKPLGLCDAERLYRTS